jgi:phospholipid transport system substrate-binding protein
MESRVVIQMVKGVLRAFGRPRTVLLIVLVLFAMTGPETALAVDSPQSVIKLTTDRFLASVRSRHAELKADPADLYKLVSDIVMPAIDIDLVTDLVLGKHRNRIDETQRRRFQDAFTHLVVRTYGSAMLDVVEDPNRLHIGYLSTPSNPSPNDAVVRTEIQYADKPPIPVDYRMRLNHGQWKTYDVIIAGVSIVITNRSTVSDRMRTQGIDQLIGDLEARAAGKTASGQAHAEGRP